jgi:hypothetical protein
MPRRKKKKTITSESDVAHVTLRQMGTIFGFGPDTPLLFPMSIVAPFITKVSIKRDRRGNSKI